MNPSLLISALRARYRLLLLIMVATVVATIIVSMLVPKTYVAKVSLLLDSKDEQSIRSTNGPPERERAGYLQTQVDIVTSPTVARRVISELKLADNPEFRAKFESLGSQGNIEDWLAEAMIKRLKADTSQSSILQLSYASSESRTAARIANAFAKSYMDTVLDLRVNPTRMNSIWFNDQLKELRENMEKAQARLLAYQREHRIIGNDERLDVETIQLSELASQIVRARDPELAARVNSGAEGMADPEARAAAGAVPGLRAELARAEARLREISSEFGPRHPQYIRQNNEVESLRGRIQSASRHAAVSSALAAERYRQSREKLIGELDEQRERVFKIKEARNQMASYSYDAAVAQRIYETAMQSFLTASIDSRALQTNVRVLNPATPPILPKSPKIPLNIALSVVIGLLLGLATVYLLEMIEQRVRQLEDLAWDPNIPVLGVLSPWNTAAARLPGYPSRYALPAPGSGSGHPS